MQQDIGQVMSPRMKAEDLAIRHVRQPAQRTPIVDVCAQKRPFHIRPRETSLHVDILRHKAGIVVIQEVMPQRRQEDSHHQKE